MVQIKFKAFYVIKKLRVNMSHDYKLRIYNVIKKNWDKYVIIKKNLRYDVIFFPYINLKTWLQTTTVGLRGVYHHFLIWLLHPLLICHVDCYDHASCTGQWLGGTTIGGAGLDNRGRPERRDDGHVGGQVFFDRMGVESFEWWWDVTFALSSTRLPILIRI